MALKLLDIDYLRARNTFSGQVLVTGSNLSVTTTSTLVINAGNVGIGSSSPSQTLAVNGTIGLFGTNSALVFPDGSSQSTSANNAVFPGGNSGAVQYNNLGNFAGDTNNLYWDSVNKRLGVGTNSPRSTFQIIDVGYESTNVSTSDILPVVLDSFPVPAYRSCHYIVQITDVNNSWFQTSQVMVLHDGLNSYQTEYNIVSTYSKMGEITTQIVGGNVQLFFTPFYTSDKNIKVIRTSIEP